LQQRGVPHRGYDLAQAQRLMESAGWQRGGDGSYRSVATGEPFSVDLREKDIEGNVKESAAVSAQWRAAGLAVNQLFHRNGSPDDPMLSSTTRGLMALPLREVHLSFAAFSSSNISSEATRWRGNNVGGYSSPEFDRLYDQSLVTLDMGQRRGLIADFVKVEATDAASINLFYDMAQQSIIFRKGVRGPALTSIEQLAPAWNIHTWEVD
jgi:ABC-type transport system substrate-binding protein